MSYNATRGTDGCGIFINGEVKRGVKELSDIRDMISKEKLEITSKKYRSVLAHARKSSRGGNNIENTHPFKITHNNRTMYFCHNGTIENIYQMAKKYEVDDTNINVDSHILGKIILEKGYDVLNNYIGGAALMWCYDDEPNTVYLFKGYSKKYINGNMEEERPLFLIKESEGIYISSMQEALRTVTNTDGEILTIDENKVIKIKNNKFICEFEADREQVGNFFTPQPTKSISTVGSQQMIGTNDQHKTSDNSLNIAKSQVVYPDIYEECTYSFNLDSIIQNAVYYLAGRYYSITDLKDFSDFKKQFPFGQASVKSNNFEKFLLNGYHNITFYLNQGLFDNKCLSFIHPNTDSKVFMKPFYFYEGVLIKDPVRFEQKKMKEKLNNLKNIFEKTKQLSSYSLQPITYKYSDTFKMKNNEIGKFYYKGNIVKNYEFGTLFTFRKYKINEGIITQITSENPKDKIVLDNSNIFDVIYDENEEEIVIYRNKTTDDIISEEQLNGLSINTNYYFKDSKGIIYSVEGKELFYNWVTDICTNITEDMYSDEIIKYNLEIEAFVECIKEEVLSKYESIGILQYLEEKYIVDLNNILMNLENYFLYLKNNSYEETTV